jgi:GH18 family chitinase
MEAKNAGERPMVVGYLPQWKLPYTPQWQKITHLCLAFGTVNSDGSLSVANIEKLRGHIADARSNKVKVLLSIGGGGSREFSEALLDKGKRTFLKENIIKAVKDFNLDGADIDFEEWAGSPDGASREDLLNRDALESLYKELREKMGKEKLITAAVSASWDNGGWGFYHCYSSSMYQYLDFVSLMLYDETGPWSKTKAGQHAAWDYFENSIHYWLHDKKLPKEKLVAGVPFYGYLFKSKDNGEGAASVDYRDILKDFPNQDAHLKDNIGLLYYNGMETIKKKAKYILDNNLAGIMIWELTQDTDLADKSLLHVIYETFK